MKFRAGSTAVIVDLPEALGAVGSWRRRFDTSAPLGVPPHVTIIVPFVDLAAIAAAEPAFPVTFAGFGTFPGSTDRPVVLYLEPPRPSRSSG